jgi:membrane-associated phospholipid phosphatase
MLRYILPLAALVAVAACSENSTGLGPSNPPTPPAEPSVETAETNAPVYWNAVARELVATYRFNALQAIRGYSIVSLAQYNAAIAAEKARVHPQQPEDGKGVRASVHAAISAASVVALTYLHPTEASALQARMTQYLDGDTRPSERNKSIEAGEAIGREIGAQVVERAKNDGFFAPWTGTVPTGAGKWVPNGAPVGPMVGQAKPYFMTSGKQFRPAAPPAFGSTEFNDALAEIRKISDTRTEEQKQIAIFWNLPAGTHQPPGYWNEEAANLALRFRQNEREAAYTMALMNMVSYDAIVASHEAKYHYWLLRPSQADPGIVLPIGLPNFPSYPSNHASISAAMARVLGDRFPSESRRLDDLADQAALSRIYGGIHYRFDGDVGLSLGRTVAMWALSQAVNSRTPFEIR